jgi:hypothetical protein
MLVEDGDNLIFDNSGLLSNSGVENNRERYKHIHPGRVTWLFPTPSTQRPGIVIRTEEEKTSKRHCQPAHESTPLPRLELDMNKKLTSSVRE